MSRGAMLVLALVASASTTSAFVGRVGPRTASSVASAARLGSRRAGTSALSMMAGEKKYQVVLVRHGESTWNDENKFTGWYDCPLSTKGLEEAKEAGKALKAANFKFDLGYTSVLRRAIHTLWLCMEELDLMWIPVKKNWRLNERHYGALQGLNKKETVEKHGIDQVNIWRRSYDIPPPPVDTSSEHYPGNDPKYAGVPKSELPLTESLKTTKARFLPLWENEIVPDIKAGKRLVIAAHGNTIRALVQHLDGISEDVICELNVPTGVPLIYDLDENMKPVKHADAIAPLQGHYLGDQEKIRAKIAGVAAQTGPKK